MTTKHTPTPWNIVGPLADSEPVTIVKCGDHIVSHVAKLYPAAIAPEHGGTAFENAVFIVTAVNAHDELAAALREAEALIPELVRQLPYGAPMSVATTHDRIRAALASVQS